MPNTVSRHLPMEPVIRLKTWFPRSLLQEAMELLFTTQPEYLFFRQASGLLFPDGLTTRLRTIPSDSVAARFVCRDSWCSRCKPVRRENHRCVHVAATALFGLLQQQEQCMPTPLLFPDSPWAILGRFLGEQSERSPLPFTLSRLDAGWEFRSGRDDLQLRLCLTEEGRSLLGVFHPSLAPPDSQPHPQEQALRSLMDELVTMELSENERQLAWQGMQSRGMQRDNSLWARLTHQLFLQTPKPSFLVTRNPEGLFQIQLPDSPDRFSLQLPREHSPELLTRVFPDSCYRKLPPARPYSRVAFSADSSSLAVSHRLEDSRGRSWALSELEPQRYGIAYYIEGDGFLPQAPLPAAEELQAEPVTQAPSLFSLNDNPEKKLGFTVPRDAIPAFLQHNSKALGCGRHEVEPNLLAISVTRTPDHLVLTSLEEADGWCYLAGFYQLGNQQIDLATLLERGGNKDSFIPGPRWLQLDNSDLAWFHGLGGDRILPGRANQVSRIRLRPYELLALNAQLPIQSPPKRSKLGKQLKRLLAAQDPAIHQASIQQAPHLRDYQHYGVAWMHQLAANGLGGILADDMGLGKTHQALALLNLLADKEPDSIFLLVCPAAVLYHWVNKARLFFPALGLQVFYGNRRALDDCQDARVILTTYATMRNDAAALQAFAFRLIFFDEMHTLKNRTTATYRAACELRAASVIGLTGTPVENHLGELQSLFDLSVPGLFHHRSFRRQFVENDCPESRLALRRIISPFILRRTRQQVLKELPPVIEDIRTCRLHDDQVGLYRQTIALTETAISEGERTGNSAFLLPVITRLKQICDHPCLLEGCTNPDQYGSGKWELFTELVEECRAAGAKAVVFSQYTAMLDIMETYLAQQQIACTSLRGDMTPAKRQHAIEQFNTSPEHLFCCASLLASGVGIDLTGAQVVIHFDRWWNPAREEQATARVHRMGQKRVVQVIKLLTQGTLEEKIHLLLEKKRQLADDIITEDDVSVLKGLSPDALQELLALRDDAVAIFSRTRQTMKKESSHE